MTTAAEVDVIAKALCKAIKGSQNAKNISKYQSILIQAFPMLPAAKVDMPRFGMSFQPWHSWTTPNTSPEWWSGNNKVKHERDENFRQANLKNVLNAISALLVLLLLLHSKDSRYFPQIPRLFVPHMFASREGNLLRLLIPDDAQLPSNWGQTTTSANQRP